MGGGKGSRAVGNDLTYDHATHYSYDIHGNVKELVQDNPQLALDAGATTPDDPAFAWHRYKHIAYTYDLISGNVKQVDYQEDRPDQFHHRYEYDADNRITRAGTSADGLLWYKDAEYFYYPHGPLERVELGQSNVQGVDYAYTLQGWLKGINSDRLTPLNDMGLDGAEINFNPNKYVGRDAFGFSIAYFGDADYQAIHPGRWNNQNGKRPFAPAGSAGSVAALQRPLYNGNIARTVQSLQPFGLWTAYAQPGQVLAQVYRYDQLNRLKSARGVDGLTDLNTWHNVNDPVVNRYLSEYAYDANGNILTADRWSNQGAVYDQLRYKYQGTQPQGTPPPPSRAVNNRLYELYDNDPGTADNPTPDDIRAPVDPNTTPPGTPHLIPGPVNGTTNYRYDELGNLVHDTREQVQTITWTVAGKVAAVERTAGSSRPPLAFGYGADGQRISKTVGDPLNGGYREYYLRDAQGNVMAMYKYAGNGTSLKATDRPIYGSSRLGSYARPMELMGQSGTLPPNFSHPIQRVHLRYELTDHLGNVSAVVTGRLLPVTNYSGGYEAELVSAQGYDSGPCCPGGITAAPATGSGSRDKRRMTKCTGPQARAMRSSTECTTPGWAGSGASIH